MVCKRWWDLSKSDLVWRRKYELFVVRRGIRNEHLLPSSYKQLLFRSGKNERERILKHLSLDKVDCRKNLRLRKLSCSVGVTILDKNGEMITHHEKPLSNNLTNGECEVLTDLTDSSLAVENMGMLTVWCVVPLFPTSMMNVALSPRQYIISKQVNLSSFSPSSCACMEYSEPNFFRIHNCVRGLLIGQWEDSTVAFVSAVYSLTDFLNALKKIICGGDKNRIELSRNIITPCVEEHNAFSNFDLSAYILFTDFTRTSCGANIWRSFECPNGQCRLVSPDDRGSHVLLDHFSCNRARIGSFDVTFQKLFVIRFMMLLSDGRCFWSLSQWVALKPAKSGQMHFEEERGRLFSFAAEDEVGKLTGMILIADSTESPHVLVDLKVQLNNAV
ncbi:unnamed protein product [Calicophoron daubneyi]|uniref:F-box domain-containing protein n=1 Tax=Calicophoron daubneyi TaxID=300641 RepID=A0AAV2TZE1_CALDB